MRPTTMRPTTHRPTRLISKHACYHLLSGGLVSIALLWAAPSHAGSGPEGPKPTEHHYSALKQAQTYAASNYSRCPRANKIGQGATEWLGVLSEADDFIKAAKCNSGGKDKRCKEVATLRANSCKSLNTLFASCFASPAAHWYNIVSALVRVQNFKAVRDAMPLLDKWMVQIGTEKAAYWANAAKKMGSWAKYAQRKGNTLVPYGSRKGKKPKYIFGLKDKHLYLTIYGSKSRAKLKGKPKNDYLTVRVQPNAYYLVDELKAKAKWHGKNGVITLPLQAWRTKMAAMKAHGGDWATLEIVVYHTWIGGKGWRTINGKRVWADVWRSAKFDSTSVLVKLR